MNQLVIQLARMGDVLQTKRLLLSLAAEGDVHLLVDNSLVSFASHIYPFANVHGITAHASRIATSELLGYLLPQLAELRTHNFQTVYNLNFSGLNLALSTLWKPEILRGHWLDRGQAFKSSWLNLAFRFSGGADKRRTSPLNLMDLWGLLANNPIAPCLVNPAASFRKNKDGQKGALGVMLAGRMARRSIPPEFLAKCIAAVCQRMGGAEIFLFGTKQEAAAAKEVMRSLPANLLSQSQNLAGQTSLLELSDHISKLNILLTPDTGGMHLAAHHGVPVEAFFLSSAWAYETGPYGEGHRVWQAVQPCLPCLESQPCPYEVKCLKAFKESSFLKMLFKPESMKQPPEGLIGLDSGVDELGVTYNSITANDLGATFNEAENKRHTALRQLLKEYSFGKLAEGMAERSDIPVGEASILYEQVFRESDWMLPPLD